MNAATPVLHNRVDAALSLAASKLDATRLKQVQAIAPDYFRRVDTEDVADISLRVDDHPEPLAELRRLLEVYYRDSAPFRAIFPTRARPYGIYDPREIEALWAKSGRAMRFEK